MLTKNIDLEKLNTPVEDAPVNVPEDKKDTIPWCIYI